MLTADLSWSFGGDNIDVVLLLWDVDFVFGGLHMPIEFERFRHCAATRGKSATYPLS